MLFGGNCLRSYLLILHPADRSIFALPRPVPEKGSNEVQIWAGGGHSVSGGRGDTGAFNAGLRYGWVLTGPHLPSFLRGRFEYAVDAVPVFLVFQPAEHRLRRRLRPARSQVELPAPRTHLTLSGTHRRRALHRSQRPHRNQHRKLHGPGSARHAHPRRETTTSAWNCATCTSRTQAWRHRIRGLTRCRCAWASEDSSEQEALRNSSVPPVSSVVKEFSQLPIRSRPCFRSPQPAILPTYVHARRMCSEFLRRPR